MHHEITQDEIRIRLATADNIPFVQSLAERFSRVGTPPWRDPAQMWQFHRRSMQEISAAISNPDDLVLIAEDVRSLRLGFLHVSQTPDFFTGEQQGYISDGWWLNGK